MSQMDQLLAAVQTILNPPDAHSHVQANEWLMSFQKTPDAWSASLHLLRHPSSEFRFFGASTLHLKVKSEWSVSAASGGLTMQQQQAIMNQVLAELRHVCEQPAGQGQQATASKLALALAAMAAKTTNGPSELIASLLPAAPTPSLTALPSVILLEVLSALAEEVQKLHGGSYVRTEEVSAQLRRHSDAILAVLATFVCEGVAHRAAASDASTAGSLTRSLGLCLGVLQAWSSYGVGLEQLHACGALTAIGQLFGSLIQSPHASLELLEQVTELLEQSISTTGFPRPASRDAAVDETLAILMQARAPYAALVHECVRALSQGGGAQLAVEQSEQACVYVARISAAIGETEMDYLACLEGSDEFPVLSPGGTTHAGPDAQAQPEPNPLHSQYFEFHLELTQHPYDLLLVESTLDVWSALQDQPVAERKFDFLKKDIFIALVRSLLRHAAYPTAFTHWHLPLGASTSVVDVYFRRRFADDADAFRRFRAIMVETFLSCYGILGLEYVEILADALAVQKPGTPANAATPSWQSLEAALMAFLPIASELAEALSSFFTDTRVAPQSKLHMRGLLDAISQKVWSWAPSETNPTAQAQAPALLLATGCAFVRCYGFMMQHAENDAAAQHQLEQNVTYLLRCIPVTQAAEPSANAPTTAFSDASTASPQDAPNIAGLAFRALCKGDARVRLLLLRTPNLIWTMVRLLFSTDGFSDRIATGMKQLWLQGLASLIAAITYSEEHLSQIGADSSAMGMATHFLKEITSPGLDAIGRVCRTLQTLQTQHGGTYNPTPAELDQIRAGVRQHLKLIGAVLKELSYPADPTMLQCKEQLLDRISELPAGHPRPTSVALQVFSSCWPHLNQLIALFAPLRDGETLDGVIGIYTTSVSLLYPHELTMTLTQMLHSAMQVYTAMPLPSVLALVEKAIATNNYGHIIDLRDTWCSIIAQIYKLTMNNTKDHLKSHTDVFDAFFDLCASLYENCTYCFVCNPANPLTHILQFCVTVLDSLASHRSTMQKCLYFLDQLLGNTAAVDILPEKAELRQMVQQIYSEQGGGLVRQLLSCLTESLPPLINSKIAHLLFLSLERFPELTRDWIEKGIMSEYFRVGAPHLTDDEKRLILAIAWPLRQNKYQWKSFWVQVNLVCQKTDTIDSLLAFQLVGEDAASAKLRGSPQQDAAFATL